LAAADVDIERGAGDLDEDRVEEAAAGAGIIVDLAALGAGTADDGHVVDERDRVGLGAVLVVAVELAALVAVNTVAGHDREPELAEAGEALVVVEGVVVVVGGEQILAVHGAAEPLEAVVLTGDDLDELEGGAGADAAHGEAVDL